MPGAPFAHLCFLVKDLERAIEDWTKTPSVFDPTQLEQPLVRQHWESGDDVMEAATFVNPNGCEIQLLTDGKWEQGERVAVAATDEG